MSVPADVVALADRRAAARLAKDFAESDRLRDAIAVSGWVVTDGPGGYQLAPRPPFAVLNDVRDLPDNTGVADSRRCTVALLAEGWPEDLIACVEALLTHAPDDVVIVVLDNGDGTGCGAVVHDLAVAHPGRVEELHVARAAGWGAARQALLGYDVATVHVLMDPSTVLTGDALSPLLAAFDDATVAGAGWRGVRVVDGWQEFEDAGSGEVEALLGYLFAVRRSAALQVPLPPKATFYRNADMEWSYLLRDAGVGRLVVPNGELPLRQDRHHGYHDTDPSLRDKESRRTYERFLTRFRGRDDLRLPR